jgi:hypothetical protein
MEGKKITFYDKHKKAMTIKPELQKIHTEKEQRNTQQKGSGEIKSQ